MKNSNFPRITFWMDTIFRGREYVDLAFKEINMLERNKFEIITSDDKRFVYYFHRLNDVKITYR